MLRSDLQLTVGQQIADLRTKKGPRQDHLASRIRISRQHMSRIENGHSPIDIYRLRQIAEHLGVTISSIVSVVEPARPEMTPELTEKRSIINQCMLDLEDVIAKEDLIMLSKIIKMMVEKQREAGA
jgi:transcriptional regulator with XRE-family HTH domain